MRTSIDFTAYSAEDAEPGDEDFEAEEAAPRPSTSRKRSRSVAASSPASRAAGKGLNRPRKPVATSGRQSSEAASLGAKGRRTESKDWKFDNPQEHNMELAKRFRAILGANPVTHENVTKSNNALCDLISRAPGGRVESSDNAAFSHGVPYTLLGDKRAKKVCVNNVTSRYDFNEDNALWQLDHLVSKEFLKHSGKVRKNSIMYVLLQARKELTGSEDYSPSKWILVENLFKFAKEKKKNLQVVIFTECKSCPD
jgi:hypothetical protein